MNAEREANARLIAAAPDLLAALRAARGYVSQPKVLAAILSAIAKATGASRRPRTGGRERLAPSPAHRKFSVA